MEFLQTLQHTDFLKRVREMSMTSASSLILFFNVWNVAIFLICNKVLPESHLDIARIARSKQYMGNPNSEGNR